MTIENIANALASLRDVAGVVGSLLISADGQPLARDLPSLFTDDLLIAAAPRVASLVEGIGSDTGELHLAVLRYAEQNVYLRRFSGGTLFVLSALNVNAPALKMGMNLVVRRMEPLLGPAAPPPATSAARDPSDAGAGIKWRGGTVTPRS